MIKHTFRKRPLAIAVSSALAAPALYSGVALAETTIEEVVVTATRRAESIQDIPINISALSGQDLERNNVTDLAEMAKWVPGLHIIDQGPRSSDQIIVRGLNVDTLGASEGLGNDAGGTVATYVGEIPMYVDLKMNDMQRVEVLLGPQGTLYGAGTMAGAIRYIPNKPSFDGTSFSFRADAFSSSEADDFGTDFGFTFNHAFSDTLSFRANVDYLDDPGFIDYNFLVRELGVSRPEPDFSNPADVAANLRQEEDVNWEETLSGRLALRWTPTDNVDATLTYYYQDMEVGGRNINSDRAFNSGKYVSAKRVEEPNERENELIALEITADLGFAELTSATGWTSYEETGQRDQNDLLITLEYSYEAFPAFIAPTREFEESDRFNHEMRLVSTAEGPHGWIVGAFYNKYEEEGFSQEFTPGLDQFWVDLGVGVSLRPDNLEYFSVSESEVVEQAIYGEYSYEINDQWTVTIGGRYYEYELDTRDAVDFPFFRTVFLGDDPDSIILDYQDDNLEDDGSLFKFNVAYQATDDILAYFTISEGYRIGGKNGVAPCPDPLPTNQIACALPNEQLYTPDETTNYELGVHSQWMDNRLTLNGAIYLVEWDGPQLASSTLNASIPITKNGEGAEATGIETSFQFYATDNLTFRGSYSYNKAELTDDAPDLMRTFVPPGFNSTAIFVDGQDGDRLPGSPEHQGTLFVTYNMRVMDMPLTLNYGIAAISDVITKTGERASGETLSGYAIHTASASLDAGAWTATLYANNLTDKYAETAVISNTSSLQTTSDINGDPVTARSYAKNVLPPRTIGLRFTYEM